MKNIFKEIYTDVEPQQYLSRLLHETLNHYNSEEYEGSGIISVYMIKDSERESVEKLDVELYENMDITFIDTDDRTIESRLDEIVVACTMYVSKKGNRIINFLTYTNGMYEIHSYPISSTNDRWQKVYDYFKNKIRNDKFKKVDKLSLSVMIAHF